MLHRFIPLWTVLIATLLLLGACRSNGVDQTPVPNPGDQTTVLLPSGGGAIFPAGSFTAATAVEVDESLTGTQRDTASFPTNAGLLLGATTVKVPAGVALQRDIEVRVAISPPQPTNMSFTVFEFNATTLMWETTANGAASAKGSAAMGTVSGGSVVSFTADTAGTLGLNATYGVFENYSQSGGPGPGPGPEPNQIPTVSLTADNTSVDADVVVNLSATGSDADGDPLTFSWMAAGGTLGTANTAGGTSTNTWSASAGGSYTVSVSVNDGNGGVDTDAVNITVAGGGPPAPANDPPEFEVDDDGEDVTGDVTAPFVGQKIWLTAVAHDPEGGDVTYEWSGPGTFSSPTVDDHGARVFWAPDSQGSQTATCTASDPEGNEATADYTTDVASYPAATDFDFVGYATCLGCHSYLGDEGEGTGWFSTNHSDALQRNLGPDNAHGYRNESCYSCHALGWDPNDQGQGFIDIELTPEYGNIQCESCHGGGSETGMGPGHKPIPWNPGLGYATDSEGNWIKETSSYVVDAAYDGADGWGCGICHEGSRHGAFEEWAVSGHATAENTEEDEDNPGTMIPHHNLTGDGCAFCHNGQEFVRVQIDGEDAADVELTLADLPNVRVGCATCHDPHNNQYEAQLRVDSEGEIGIPFSDTDDVPTMVMAGKGNICVACHNGRRDRGDYEERVWEGSGHFGPHGNSQGPMLFGVMGGDLGNPPVATTYEDDHPHRTWNENSCVTCHMYRRPYIDSENPQLWGHNFEPRFERCITCHSNFTDEAEFWEWVEEYEAEVDVLLQAFRDAWPAAWLDDDGEPNNRDTDPPTGVGPPREDAVGAAYRAALWNYMLVEEDGSHGIHNPTFTKSLIEEGIAAVEALPAP